MFKNKKKKKYKELKFEILIRRTEAVFQYYIQRSKNTKKKKKKLNLFWQNTSGICSCINFIMSFQGFIIEVIVTK